MISTITFLGGLGAGAVVTTLLFLLLINRLVGQRSKDGERMLETSEASVAELRRRNDIGERIATLLASVIDPEKGTLRMVDVERGNVYKTHLGGKLSEAPSVQAGNEVR